MKSSLPARSFRTHFLKIRACYADDVYAGNKPFEIRKNDRDYRVGDHIIFNVIDDLPEHPLNKLVYKITYVFNEFGVADDYAILGIQRLGVVGGTK